MLITKGVCKLIFYMITDGHGSYIRKDEFSGKYVPVRSYALADRFEQRCKAVNVLNNAIGKNIRNRYKVIDIEEGMPSPKPQNNYSNKLHSKDKVAKAISEEATGDSQTEKWASGAKAFTEFVMDAEKRKEELTNLLSEVDKEISDVNHYIEFGKFNAYQGWLAFSMLQNRLRKRRKIKDELQVIQQLGESKITLSMLEGINKAVSELANRKYTPRVLNELFE